MAASTITIVCYHYVRELKRSRFPGIKGLELEAFREQVRYFKKFYQFVSAAELRAAIDGQTTLPKNAVILTFDDGYIDHFTCAFPIMEEMGATGCFYPPVHAIRDGKLLDVNKIHFALAACANFGELSDEVFAGLEELRSKYSLPSSKELWNKYAVASRHDPAEIVFVKRVLQKGIIAEARAEIADRIFKKFVTSDEVAFARELYLNEDQIRCMLRHGMHFGSHAATHRWLDSLSGIEQAQEIDESVKWLESLGATNEFWSMCYPFGAYNEATLKILAERKCAFGVTVNQGLAEAAPENRFILKRLDTNEFPKAPTSAPNAWTQQVI